jgi:voltage-gated potassium channel
MTVRGSPPRQKPAAHWSSRWWRKIRAGYRDTILLFREFRQPLILFTLVIAGSGWLYYFLAETTTQPLRSLAQGMYVTLTLSFLQPTVPFPDVWYLQLFFFLMPVIGIGILAQGLTDFGVLLFNRRARGKEWEMAVASTFTDHVVIVGLGHLGYRVVLELHDFDREVVVIEREPDQDLLNNVRDLGIPVLVDDASREAALTAASIQKARSIILCTQNDSLNLRVALKARNINPNIDVVLRIFDDDFAASLQAQFGFHALSATSVAAPLFAGLATHLDVTPPITIEGKPHILANLPISKQSRLNGLTVHHIEEHFRISIVLLCEDGHRQFHPPGERTIQPGFTIAVFGEPEQINKLLHENRQ